MGRGFCSWRTPRKSRIMVLEQHSDHEQSGCRLMCSGEPDFLIPRRPATTTGSSRQRPIIYSRRSRLASDGTQALRRGLGPCAGIDLE